MYKLLIVEDDTDIAEAIREQCTAWGLEAHVAEDLRDVTGEFLRVQPHLVLLDITLPFYNGYHWCAELRKLSHVPILFLSSASDNLNIVMAMNMGADDFIAKPFDLSVLMAKVRSLLRRSYDFAVTAPVLAHRGAFLHTGDNLLLCGDERITLTKNEYRILLCLMENKGRVVSREALMERLWETDSFVDENTLSVNVNRLRKKLDGAGLAGFIATRVGAGVHLCFAFPLLWRMLQLFNLDDLRLVILVTAAAFLGFSAIYAVLYKLTARTYYHIVSDPKTEG